MSQVRRFGRFVGLLGVLLGGVGLLPVLPMLAGSARRRAGRLWARALLGALGVRVRVRGRLPDRAALLVANHISWLDVIAVLAVAPARMLAKQEVRRWPLIGPLAAAGGTIFVRRDRPRALPQTVAEVAAALRSGAVVAVFPEGTTWCGRPGGRSGCGGAGRFRPAMFQAAIDAKVPVVPVAVRYQAGVDPVGTTAAAFLGRDSLWASLRRVTAVSGLVVSLVATGEIRPGADGAGAGAGDGRAAGAGGSGTVGAAPARRRLAAAAESATRPVGGLDLAA